MVMTRKDANLSISSAAAGKVVVLEGQGVLQCVVTEVKRLYSVVKVQPVKRMISLPTSLL